MFFFAYKVWKEKRYRLLSMAWTWPWVQDARIQMPWVESTWNSSDVKKWQKEARRIQNTYRMLLSPHDYDVFEGSIQHMQLKAKILYAINSEPSADGYSEEQEDHADNLKKKIVNLASSRNTHVGFVYVYGKMENQRFIEPVFRVANADMSGDFFVDRKGRVYKDWEDWEQNNHLPKCLYCYPKGGLYRSEAGNPHDVAVDCGTSPACDLKSRIGNALDTVCIVVNLAAFGLGVAGCFSPISPIAATYLMVSGTYTGLYTAGRSAANLVDKAEHRESLTDPEAIACWVNIASTILGISTESAVNSTMARARHGELVNRAARIGLRVLQYGKLGVHAVGTINHMAMLLDKKAAGELTPLDAIQFSASLFFFSNILLKPDAVGAVLEQVQREAGGQGLLSAEDNRQLRRLQSSVSSSRSEGDDSVVVRRIHRVRNSSELLSSLSDSPNISSSSI